MLKTACLRVLRYTRVASGSRKTTFHVLSGTPISATFVASRPSFCLANDWWITAFAIFAIGDTPGSELDRTVRRFWSDAVIAQSGKILVCGPVRGKWKLLVNPRLTMSCTKVCVGKRSICRQACRGMRSLLEDACVASAIMSPLEGLFGSCHRWSTTFGWVFSWGQRWQMS